MARFTEQPMTRHQCGAQRASRIASRRLDPDILKPTIPQHLAIGDAVEHDATRETQLGDARLIPQRAGQAQNRFLDHRLHRGRQVHDPDRRGHTERAEPARRERDVGFEQPLEFEEGLVVERDLVDLTERDAGLIEAVSDGVGRIARVVLFARETLFLRGGDNSPAIYEGRGAVVVERGDAENFHSLKNRVDHRRDRAALTQHDQPTQREHHNDDREQPILFADAHKTPKFAEKGHDKPQNWFFRDSGFGPGGSRWIQ